MVLITSRGEIESCLPLASSSLPVTSEREVWESLSVASPSTLNTVGGALATRKIGGLRGLTKVGTTKSTRHERRDIFAIGSLDSDAVTNVSEDIFEVLLPKRDFEPVAVSQQILEGMQSLAKETIGLEQISTVVSTGLAGELDGFLQRPTDVGGRGVIVLTFASDIVLSMEIGLRAYYSRALKVLHLLAGLVIDLQFNGFELASQLRMELLRWFRSISISFGVVHMFDREVDTKAIGGKLEFFGSVAKGLLRS